MSQYGWDNCPPETRRQIEKLIKDFKFLLAENLVGVYLHGSLATACFNPQRSDIDLLVAARRKIPVEIKPKLARLLLDTSLNPRPIEISFLNLSDLSCWQHPLPCDFHYSEDWRAHFEESLKDIESTEWSDGQRFDDDLAAHITVPNERGVCLYGAPVSEVFPSVPERDFLDSILGDVLSPKYGLDAILQHSPYVVLNACRTLAYLKTTRVMSKEEGGRWALENLPAQHHQTVRGALNAYRDRKDEGALNKKELIEFADYMKQELKRAAAQ